MTRRTRTETDAQHLTDRTRRATIRQNNGDTQTSSIHYTAGADEPLPEWQTTAATRYIQRQPDAALLLDALGLAPALAPAPSPDRTGQYQTAGGAWVHWAVCHECGVRVKIRRDGTFQLHARGRRGAVRCPASRRKPQLEGSAG